MYVYIYVCICVYNIYIMYAYYIITLYAISPSDQSYWDNQQFTH